MPSDQTVSRGLHDLGAAAWFGGALMGAVGLNEASSAMQRNDDRVRVAEVGWRAWQPWKAAAIAAHVAGSLGLLWGNKARLAGQRGAMTVNIAKTGVFAAALGADLYAAALGRRVAEQQPAPVDSAVDPGLATPEDLAETQRQLRAAQWAVAALTGANVVLGAKMGEQQRPTSLVSGIVDRLGPNR